jgi:hypothetical protein
MKRKILNDAFLAPPSGPLYHYTNQTGLLGIIGNGELWATHTQYLNDSQEFLHAYQMMEEKLDDWLNKCCDGDYFNRDLVDETKIDTQNLPLVEEMVQGLTEAAGQIGNVCVASFSEVRDSLSQWRAYGHGAGFCIGFRNDQLSEIVKANKLYLARCVYDLAHQESLVQALIEEVRDENLKRRDSGDESVRLPPGGNLLAYLRRYGPILKHSSFAEEREWRIITMPQANVNQRFHFREGPSMLIPFYKLPLALEGGDLPIEEVVVGPAPHPERSMASVRNFLVSRGLRVVKVTVSEVPYRNW